MAAINLACVDGVRCLCCLWIIFMHSHAFSSVFPWQSPGMIHIREFPILGFFATSTLAVDVFWLLSGFLCEYQLYEKVDKTKSFWYIWFFINRLLRLYPLYLVNILLVYTSPMDVQCTTITRLVKAITFVEFVATDGPIKDNFPVNKCSAAGWSLNTDVHGYLFIILLFIIFRNYNDKYKKYVLWMFYIISCILTMKIIAEKDIKWPVMAFGLEATDSLQLDEYFEKYPEKREEFPDPRTFYPDIDLMTDVLIEYRERTNQWMYHLYFTSILKHGAAMFLGSILAINQRNNDKKQPYYNMIKIIIGCIAFYITMDLRMDLQNRSIFWTFVYDKLFIIAVYFVLDAILSIDSINNIFDNKWIKRFSKYTYGIYLFHLIPVMIIVMTSYPSDVENGGIGENNYGFIYLFKLTAMSLICSLIIAVILYWLLEYPMMLFRYKYIRPRYSIKQTKKEN